MLHGEGIIKNYLLLLIIILSVAKIENLVPYDCIKVGMNLAPLSKAKLETFETILS